jgi:ParB-like chromosome segregation protein Spo0J
MKAKESPPLLILYQKIDQLKPYAHNARTHTKRQIKQIAESIRVFGWTNPILIDINDTIIAGHGRVEAARLAHRRWKDAHRPSYS